MFIRRPKPGDDEEDLLDFQTEFLASGKKPCAKVIKCYDDSIKNKNDASNTGTPSFVTPTPTDENMEEEMDKYDTHITAVLSNVIKEKKLNAKPSFPSMRAVANPQATRCQYSQRKASLNKKIKKKSIFAQQCAMQNKQKNNTQFSSEEDGLKIDLHQMFPTSRLVTGEGIETSENDPKDIVKSIHEENITKLSQMCSSEIEYEQQKLKESLDVKLLKFLTERKLGKDSNTSFTSADAISADAKKKDVHSEVMEHEPLPISEQVDEKWLHMDQKESEKMDWMKAVPNSSKFNISLPDRFDFEASLLSIEKSKSLPSHIGLHHHGGEPDLAGYTLQELMLLARSQFSQQQVFALRLISKIVIKDKSGAYSARLPQFVTPLLLEAGLAFILRWALDSRSDNCVQAAVEALHAFLQPSQVQRQYLDAYFVTYRGCELPSFLPPPVEDDNGKKEERDHELASRDLVKGFLQMNILSRIRYVLEVCKLDRSTAYKCLEVLQRFCQHSMESAVKVLDCPRLIKFVIDEYLPVVWPSDCPMESGAGKWPCGHAVRLIRLICQAGRHATSRLIHDCPSLSAFIAKVVFRAAEVESNGFHSVELETWRLWIVITSYGFYVDINRELSPTLLLEMRECIASMEDRHHSVQLERIVLMMKYVACLVGCRADKDNSSLNSEDVLGFYPLVRTIVKQAAAQLCSAQPLEVQRNLLGVIAGCLNTVTSLIEEKKNSMTDDFETQLLSSFIEPLHQIVASSISLMKVTERFGGDVDLLPSLPDLRFSEITDDSRDRLLTSMASADFIAAFLRCALSLCRRNRALCRNFVGILKIWRQTDVDQSFVATNWSGFCARTTQHCLYWLVKLFAVCTMQEEELTDLCQYYHSLVLSCMAALSPGDEELTADLLCNVVFHPVLLRDVTVYSVGSEKQRLDDVLPAMRATYTSLIDQRHLESSTTNRISQHHQQVSSYLLPHGTDPLLPTDWPFLPIVRTYDYTIHKGEANVGSPTITALKSCLHLLLIVETERREYWQRVPVTAKIMRLMCLYLSGSDVFLDDAIAPLMKVLFSQCCRSDLSRDVDFSQTVPGLTSFYDFYKSLLEQYESVSFGNPLFSAVILLPLANKSSSNLKLALWAEHSDALQIISLTDQQLLVPKHAYMTNEENDENVIRAYARALMSRKCKRSPFLFELAAHHVAAYLSNKNHPENFRCEIEIAFNTCDINLRNRVLPPR